MLAIYGISIGYDDFTLPCIWNKIFGISCPGCGLSRTFHSMLFDHQVRVYWDYRPSMYLFILLMVAKTALLVQRSARPRTML
ncbi:MAG: DUF2752 domain-containing protein [Candidatus Kapaibacteriota bacterium]